ncbi:hypothetical protein LXL04_004298 [Taraxacum kok-saghyz]
MFHGCFLPHPIDFSPFELLHISFKFERGGCFKSDFVIVAIQIQVSSKTTQKSKPRQNQDNPSPKYSSKASLIQDSYKK